MYDLQAIENHLKYAAIAQYLSANENARDKALGMGTNAGEARTPFLLDVLQYTIGWAKDYYEGTEHLDKVVNYMYSLSGKYLDEATGIIAGTVGNPGYTPASTTTTRVVSIKKSKLQYVVGSSLSEGASSITVNDNFILQGTITVTVDGVEVPEDLDFILSCTVQYNQDNSTITFNQGLQSPQVVIVNYEKISTI